MSPAEWRKLGRRPVKPVSSAALQQVAESKPTILDPAESERRAEEGIARVESNTSPEWATDAYVAGVKAAAQFDFFTTDQVWEILAQDPSVAEVHNNSAIGPIMRALVKAKVIEHTDIVRKSIRPPNHGKRLPVWKSVRETK